MRICQVAATALLIGVLFLPSTAPAAPKMNVTISSDGLQIQESTGDIRFEGNVEVELTDGVLRCDLLVVKTKGKDPSQIRSGEATGNVVLTRGSDRVEAQKAFFDLEAGKVKFSGLPRLIREKTTIQAETIIYSMDQGAVSFSGSVKALFEGSDGKPR